MKNLISFSMVAVIWLCCDPFRVQAQTNDQTATTETPKTVVHTAESLEESLALVLKESDRKGQSDIVTRIVNDKSISEAAWKRILIAFQSGLQYELPDRAIAVSDQCAKMLSAVQSRFGATSQLSTMAQMNFAISLVFQERARKAWDEYDKVAPTLETSDVNFLVNSLTKLGWAFRENFFNSDSIHAFGLADQLVASHQIDEGVQADLYNTASDETFRANGSRDDNLAPFYRYVERAITLDKKLGAKYDHDLANVLSIKAAQVDTDAAKHKK